MNQFRWYLLMSLVALIWASVFHVIKFTVDHHSPMVVAFYRYSISAIFLFTLISWRRSWPKPFIWLNFWRYCLLGIIGITAYNIFFFQGITLTSPVNGALVIALNPVTTSLLNQFFGKERFHWLQWVGLFLSFLGVLIVVSNGSVEQLLKLTLQKGNLIIFGAPLSWAIYSILSRRYMQTESPNSLAAGAMIMGAVFLLPIMFLFPDGFLSLFGNFAAQSESINHDFLPYDLKMWWVVLYTGIFASGFSYLWWSRGILQLGVNKSAVIINLIPVFTMLIDLALGNPVIAVKYLGAAIVIVGVFIVTRNYKPTSIQN